MSARRLEIPCPECGARSLGYMTLRAKDGTPRRYRKCDHGHTFVVLGGPALLRRGPQPKKEQPRPQIPTLTQWRPYPFVDTPRAVL